MTRVGERGQITLEKRIRDELGIYAGDQAIQRLENGRVVVEFVPGRHRRSLAGALRDKVTRWPQSEEWDVLREAALASPDPDRAGSSPAPTRQQGKGRRARPKR